MIRKTVEGREYESQMIGELHFDKEPKEGSFNPVTSDGVANAIGEILPAGTSEENPLMNASDTERLIVKMMPITANTLRFEFGKKDYDPTVAGVGSSGTWTKLHTTYDNIWDWNKNDTNFGNAFKNAFAASDNLVSVIAVGDTSSVVYMGSLFEGCTSLTSVPLFDTSAVTDFSAMLRGCSSITKLPLFDTSSAVYMGSAFRECPNVEEGALALYQQASTQATPPTSHSNTFTKCGNNTTTGAAELAQIPTSWGGTAT